MGKNHSNKSIKKHVDDSEKLVKKMQKLTTPTGTGGEFQDNAGMPTSERS